MKINKKICIIFVISFFLLLIPNTIYADNGDSNTTWTDDDGTEYEVNNVQITDNSIENGKYMPSSVTGEKFEGTGTVVDYVQTDTKTFYTIYTSDDKIYYLIIDNTKDTNNVYFLREINEDELNFGYQYEVINDSPYPEDEVVQVQKKEKSNTSSIIGLIVFGVLAIGAIIYFVITKNKNKTLNSNQSNQTSNDVNINGEDIYEYADEEIEDENLLNSDYENLDDADSSEETENQEEDNDE